MVFELSALRRVATVTRCNRATTIWAFGLLLLDIFGKFAERLQYTLVAKTFRFHQDAPIPLSAAPERFPFGTPPA